MVKRSGQTFLFPALALIASSALSACSGDTPVESGPFDPFKRRACFDFKDHLHTVSLIDMRGWAMAVDLADGLAYVAGDDDGLRIADFRDPAAPFFRGRADTPEPALDVVVVGGLACLTLGSGGVVVVNVGDPDGPIVVGNIGTPGNALGIAARDTVVYVADDVIGLMLFHIGDPGEPFPMGVENSPGRAADVAVAGAFAYVADRRGLKIVNVNNPWDPWRVNTVSLPYGGRGVEVGGNFAFVAAGIGGLQVVDVSTPGAEAIVGTLATRGVANHVALDDGNDVAFVSQGFNGVEVVDVTDPYAPTVVNTVAKSAEALSVAVQGGVAVVAERTDGLQAVRVASPEPPPVTARIPEAFTDEVAHVVARPGVVLGAGTPVGLFTVEIRDSTLQPAGNLALGYEPVDLAVRADTAYLAREDGGIEMVDVSDPTAPSPAGRVPYQDGVASITASEDALYFVGEQVFGSWRWGDEDVSTVDLRVTSSSAVTASGDVAYVGHRANAISVVNIQAPGRPLPFTTVTIEGSSEDIVTDEERLFVLTSSGSFPRSRNGIGVYDIRSPLSPAALAFLPLPSRPFRTALQGNTLYVAAGVEGLVVVDVGDPARPRRIGYVGSGDRSTGTAVSEGSVLVADGSGGLFTVPVHGCVPSP